MAAEALIVEDAYKRGYTDAMADMRKKKEQRRQREQAIKPIAFNANRRTRLLQKQQQKTG